MKRGRDGSDERLVDVEMDRIVHQTALAILFRSENGNDVWLPKSQIEWVMDWNRECVTVTMPEALAIEKGLV